MKAETKQIARQALIVAGMVILSYWVVGFTVWAFRKVFATGVRGDVLETVFFIVLGSLIVFYVRLTERNIPEALALRALPFNRITILFLLATVTFQLVEGAVIWSGLMVNLEDVAAQRQDASLLGGLNAVFLAPIVEEALFRGLLYRRIERIATPVMALVVSSIGFAAFHMEHGLAYCIAVAPAGFFLGYARMKSGGIALPMVLHACMNGIIVIGGLLLFGWK